MSVGFVVGSIAARSSGPPRLFTWKRTQVKAPSFFRDSWWSAPLSSFGPAVGKARRTWVPSESFVELHAGREAVAVDRAVGLVVEDQVDVLDRRSSTSGPTSYWRRSSFTIASSVERTWSIFGATRKSCGPVDPATPGLLPGVAGGGRERDGDEGEEAA